MTQHCVAWSGQDNQPDCYERNPGFLAFVDRTSLPFHPHAEFKKADNEDRGALYSNLAEVIWNPEDLVI